MNPEWIIAICAGVTLLILWTSTVIGVMLKLNGIRDAIIKDFNEKHDANKERYDALAVLVTRHETILEPEFNGTGRPYVPKHRPRQ